MEVDKIIEKDVDKIIVINIIERKSEGYYNYKTRWVAVYVPPFLKQYEEQDVLKVEEIKIYCGTYQEIKSCQDVIEELQKLGFTVIER